MLFGCSSCGCGPCPRCTPDCLSITFSGFGGTGVNCSECDYLNDVSIVAKRRQGNPSFTPGVNTTTGSGAQLTASLVKDDETGGWTLGAVAVKNGGSGYLNADSFKYTAPNSYIEIEPRVTLAISDVAPTLTATASGGAGASFSVASQENGETWQITSVSVTSGGANYPDNATLSIKSNGVTTTAAAATIVVGRQEPTLYATVESQDGYGFSGGVSLEEYSQAGRPMWRVSDISIIDGGYGYHEGDSVVVTVADGQEVAAASAVATVDENGTVTGFDIQNSGQYFKSTGAIESVTVTSGGVYQGVNGTITSATVTEPGLFWFSSGQGCGFCCHEYEYCAACPQNSGSAIRVRVMHGESDSTVLVQRIDPTTGYIQQTVLRAVRSRTEDDPTCDGLEFSPGDVVEGCYSDGTITIAAADCDQTPELPCGLPDQITLTIAGIAPVFEWRSQNGGYPGMQGWGGNGSLFNGQCGAPQSGILIRGGGIAVGPAGYTLDQTVSNSVIVLDRQPGCEISYSGSGPFLPRAEGTTSGGFGVNCKLATLGATVAIGPAPLYTTVIISSPTKGENLVNAAAEVTSLSGTSIAGITVTESGAGYAAEVMERSEPTIKATVGSSNGSGCKLSVTTSPLSTTKGQETWAVDSIVVDSPGSDYLPEDFVLIDVGDGVEESQFSGQIFLDRIEPAVTASAAGGSAALSVSLNKITDYNGSDAWEVASVTVDDPGGDYASDGAVSFSTDDGVVVSSAVGTFHVERSEPTVECGIASGTGSGAAIALSLTQSGNYWYVSAASVTSGGSGYDDGDTVVFSCTDGTENYAAYGYATFDGGVLTDVVIYEGGSYYKSNGNIESVSLADGGQYYATTGAVDRVEVYDGGSYYAEEPTGEVESDTPTVTISSNVGQNATATATVDKTIGSPTFGTITGITVTSGGSGYRTTGYGWKATVSVGPLVHRAGDTEPCQDLPQYIVHESERITTDGCPNALLEKSYKMSYRTGTRAFGDIENADDAEYCFIGENMNTLTIPNLGSGDITCTLAPA